MVRGAEQVSVVAERPPDVSLSATVPFMPFTLPPERALFGWRVWRIGLDDSGPHLASVIDEDGRPWQRRAQAMCAAGKSHDAPAQSCGCGFTVLPSVSELVRYLTQWMARMRTGPPHVIGRVRYWGPTQPGADGGIPHLRCSNVELRSLLLVPAGVEPLAHGLHKRYRLPVALGRYGDERFVTRDLRVLANVWSRGGLVLPTHRVSRLGPRGTFVPLQPATALLDPGASRCPPRR